MNAGDLALQEVASPVAAPVRDELTAVYAAAFAEPPWNRGPDAVDWFHAQVGHHIAHEGFRGLLARRDGRCVGFAYGYTSRAGAHPERDEVYRQVVDAVGDAFCEGAWSLVEIAVDPSAQRLGVGGRLHDELLARVAEPRRWIITVPEAGPALALYAARGWRRVSDAVLAPSGRHLTLLAQGLDA